MTARRLIVAWVLHMLCLLITHTVLAQSSWVSLGAPLGETHPGRVLVAPDDDNFIMVGTSYGGNGLYISRNGGVTWSQPMELATGVVGVIAIDPTNPNILFAGRGNDLYRSIDRGYTWTVVGRNGMILVSSLDGAVFVTGRRSPAHAEHGILRSYDHGDTWSFTPFGVEYRPNTTDLTFFDIAEDPANHMLYIGSQLSAHPTPYSAPCSCPFLVSSNRGDTWSDASAGFGKLHWHAPRVRVNPQTHEVYAHMEGTGLFKSADFGTTWQYVSGNGAFVWELLLDPTHPNRMFGAGLGTGAAASIYASTDGGARFRPIGPPGTPAGALLALNSSGTKLFAAVQGVGLYSHDIGSGTCLPSNDCPNQCAGPGGACLSASSEVALTVATVPSTAGALTTACGFGRYANVCGLGGNAGLTANPLYGYLFDHWGGDVPAGSPSPTSVSMTTHKAATAYFSLAPPSVPAKPTLLSPGGSIPTGRPTFMWRAVPFATSYFLSASSLVPNGGSYSQSYTPAQLGCANGGGTGYCVVRPNTPLFPAGNAQWSVTAFNAVGESGWVTPWKQFTIATGPATQLAPTGTVQTALPTYSWTAVPTASGYGLSSHNRYGVGTSVWQTFSASQVGCASGTGTCSFTPSIPRVEGSEAWSVLTFHTNGDQSWSEELPFEVDVP